MYLIRLAKIRYSWMFYTFPTEPERKNLNKNKTVSVTGFSVACLVTVSFAWKPFCFALELSGFIRSRSVVVATRVNQRLSMKRPRNDLIFLSCHFVFFFFFELGRGNHKLVVVRTAKAMMMAMIPLYSTQKSAYLSFFFILCLSWFWCRRRRRLSADSVKALLEKPQTRMKSWIPLS